MVLKEYISMVPYGNFILSNKYIYAIAIFGLFFLLSELVVIISRSVILKIAHKTKTEVDDLIVKKTNKPISLILLFIGIRLALLPLGIRQGVLNMAENLIMSVIIIIVTYISIVVIGIFIDNWGRTVAAKTKSELDDQLIPVFHRFSKIFISIIGILFVLPVWGVQIGPLLTSLGIAGIAVAFALQSTLGNIFGGVSIILDRSIKVGDKIKIDADTMGTVTDVGLRSTKIRTWDNEMITMPNGKLADSKILNFIQPEPMVRVQVNFGVEYGSEIAHVRTVVLDALSKLPNVLKEPPPKVHFDAMSEFSLNFIALFYVPSFDKKFDTKSAATEAIYNALRANGVGIPFPTRTVYFKGEKHDTGAPKAFKNGN